ncbi:MAG: DNA/RNA nuclease SfsA [Spirochaetia bacterium]|nr:DNA/RNA nuclease SfsA [Spirochaetia bacterium]MCE1208540.1 DNA/RNA nuclease SfsA [Spirochaetia bacterium]
MSTSFQIFHNHREALFVRRPNRFLVIAADPETGEELPCHCPNPGSIAEFTIPGTRLILERRQEGGKTAWTAAAVRYDGGREAIVPLFSARANKAAETLVLPRLFPRTRRIQPEYTIGESRFDFFAEDRNGDRHLIEIKACSLVECGIAMFPDAPSARALKHLEELAVLSFAGYKTHVVFMIMHGNPGRLIPNLHSDPAFAVAMGRYAGRVDCRAYALRVDERGNASLASREGSINYESLAIREESSNLAAAEVPIDLRHTELAQSDSGSYMMLLHLAHQVEIAVGGLGRLKFEPGWYIYCGSAKKGLAKRVARHRRKIGKALHWHIDYLVPHALSIKEIPIYSYRNLECDLAAALGSMGGKAIPRFGSTDCGCESHLFRFDTDPMKKRAFLDILFLFRHRKSLGL